ncbi:MAG: lysozyme inhibitor LprI family protein [Alphaproteobacteria bacterium]
MKPKTAFATCGALVFAATLGAAPPHAVAQSFDCAKASTADEQVVCTYDWLAALDEYMAERYRYLRKIPSIDKRALKQSQRAWLRDRANCGSSIGCIARLYTDRLEEFDSY